MQPVHIARRGRKAGSVIQQFDDAIQIGRRGYAYYTSKTRWSVTLTSDDRLFDIAMRWFLSDDANVKPPRSLKARYERGSDSTGKAMYIEDIDGNYHRDRGPGTVGLSYNETQERSVTINGHKVTIQLQKPDRGDNGEITVSSRSEPEKLHFFARTREGQLAVVEHLKSLTEDTDRRKPALHLLGTWGDWSRRDDLPQRQLSSVVLREGQMDRLRQDIESFLAAEPEYNRRGMPYHRGYLLYGPPGTGKTSIVRALAAHFGLDLWYAPLGDLEKDTSLMSLVNQVKPGSILLLEDIDVYHATRERDDATRGTSMAGLLNALDGVATPHGLITFLTTNDRDVIDPALLRPGRVDVHEYIGHPDAQQVADLYAFWYDRPIKAGILTWAGTTAELIEVFRNNTPEGAVAKLQKKLQAVENVQ